MPTSEIAVLLSDARDALRQPAIARVVGERVRVLSAEDAGERRGLVARVERKGATYVVSLADLAVGPTSPLHRVIAAYRTSLEPEGRAEAPAPGSPTAELSAGMTAEAVILSVKKTAARCRLVGGSATWTLRCADVAELVPGEIATVRIEKAWRHAGHPYASGEVEGSRLQVERLGLVPLRLEPQGDWDPAEEDWGEDGAAPAWARALVARGPRPELEMEQVIPGADPTDPDADPILDAVELREAGDLAGARALLMEQLAADLRCLDAHAHLGNLEFDHCPRRAIRHYEAGVRIGELGLGPAFEGVLPWALHDNRPFLRCLYGHGLSLWRLGRREEAMRVFERMLRLNPSDDQGAHFLLEDARRGLSWEEQQAEEEERRRDPYAAHGPRAERVSVDLQELAVALEDRVPGHAWYLDRETGALHFTSDELPDEDLLVGREELKGGDRFVLVEPEDAARAYRDMDDFAETVREPALVQWLRDALAGKGAFGRFKRVLADHPAERERWLGFRNERLEARARAWLAGIGVRPLGDDEGP